MRGRDSNTRLFQPTFDVQAEDAIEVDETRRFYTGFQPAESELPVEPYFPHTGQDEFERGLSLDAEHMVSLRFEGAVYEPLELVRSAREERGGFGLVVVVVVVVVVVIVIVDIVVVVAIVVIVVGVVVVISVVINKVVPFAFRVLIRIFQQLVRCRLGTKTMNG